MMTVAELLAAASGPAVQPGMRVFIRLGDASLVELGKVEFEMGDELCMVLVPEQELSRADGDYLGRIMAQNWTNGS